jgi:hypothetical protein
MPISYAIDPKQRLVTTRLWGLVTDDDVRDHNQRLRTDPAFDPSYRQLADMTEFSESRVTTNVINESSTDQFFNPGTRRAFVAATEANFGLSRKFAQQAEAVGQTIQVFRDMRSAKEWLGLD